MPRYDALLALIIILTLAFDFTNGFSDLPQAIATVVSTRIMRFPMAVLMAGGLIFAGAMSSTSVVHTLVGGLVRAESVTESVIVSAVLGALVWDVITWWMALPCSSSHALIGGLCGATLVQNGPHAVSWRAVIHDVVLPMIFSPLVGFGLAFLMMTAIVTLLAHANRRIWDPAFQYSQILSAASVAFAHGAGSGQKGMAILTLALVSAGSLRTPEVPLWVMALCTAAIVAGGASGSMRIIATLGSKITRLNPVQGFAAQACCASVVFIASHWGMPVSTTQVLSGTIMGVGTAKRVNSVRWGIAETMLGAWVLTLPAAGMVGGFAHLCFHLAGYR